MPCRTNRNLVRLWFDSVHLCFISNFSCHSVPHKKQYEYFQQDLFIQQGLLLGLYFKWKTTEYHNSVHIWKNGTAWCDCFSFHTLPWGLTWTRGLCCLIQPVEPSVKFVSYKSCHPKPFEICQNLLGKACHDMTYETDLNMTLNRWTRGRRQRRGTGGRCTPPPNVANVSTRKVFRQMVILV